MKLSNDLTLIESKNKEDVKLYNSFTNTLTELNSEIYDYLIKCNQDEDFENIYDILSKEQIDILIDNNILVDDMDTYKSKEYVSVNMGQEKIIKDVYAHLTFECNLRCKYCYQKENLNKHDVLKVEDWKMIFDTLKQKGLQRVHFTGGEPLLYSGAKEIIQYAKQLGINTTLLTNGTKINPKDDLYNYVDNIIISLDSMNDKMRTGLKPKNVLNNIIELNKDGKCKVFVRSVFTNGYEDDSQHVKDFVEEYGIKHIGVLCIPSVQDEIKFIPNYDKYDLIDEECGSSGCGAGDTIISISPAGDVYPCQLLMKDELKICNILQEDWYEKYKASNINSLINSFDVRKVEKCNKCTYRNICGGGCRGNSYIMYGNFLTRTEYLCDYYEKCARKMLENAE